MTSLNKLSRFRQAGLIALVALSGILVIGGLLSVGHSATNKEGKTAVMEGDLRLNEVDVNDAAAMDKWAHGLCRGQTVKHFANIYGVDPTMSAVVERLSQHFPKEVRGVVARACEEELKKSEGQV
jgi:hypothetical protein